MKTLNDKWLEKANNSKEKKNRIKQHRDELNNNDTFIMENARNEYIEHFSPNGCWNGKWDKVIVDAKGFCKLDKMGYRTAERLYIRR